MVSFKNKLAGRGLQAITEPLALYDTLDRASDKGPLRPAQTAVLSEWYASHRGARDVIVKLHTGQGKTLVGLLILQARLNSKDGPALYICPNNFLVSQTCEQARQFGISTCTADPDLPAAFLDSKSILVTSVQKVFNGLTKFGLHRNSIQAGTLLMDDAHACSDAIRDACKIRIPREDAAYDLLTALFSDELEHQGVGTYADICNSKYDALLPVPYWTWLEREADVARILSSGSDRKTIKFAWPILKDLLAHCLCVVSGGAIEIEPRIPPLDAFGTYWDAPHRVFMSATVTDDAFLVRGLQLQTETILKPVVYEKETWSGEKMILLPALIHEDLTREEIVHFLCQIGATSSFGVVALAPSFNSTKDWKGYGAEVADTKTVDTAVQRLRAGRYAPPLVLVNRYDGVDLPDDMCRILVFDGKPYSESLIDLYQEGCRPQSDATLMRTVRTVEQGLGRSVRGEKDYSAIVVVGTDITRLVRDKTSRQYLSPQMRAQLEIGLEVAAMASEEIADGIAPRDAFVSLLRQCLQRDADWKTFYSEKMADVRPSRASDVVLKAYSAELTAERHYYKGDYGSASSELQRFLDEGVLNRIDTGWYLQEMARYEYRARRQESQRKQVAAYTNNRLLLRPREGITVAKLTVLSQGRMERLLSWIQTHETYVDLDIAVSDILAGLAFGTKADNFERALSELGTSLGFASERPDKEWKEGPDNLWALDDTTYILWECKSEVEITRAEIDKREAEQMNRSCAWFTKYYPGANVANIIIHPAHKLGSAAAFLGDVRAMCNSQLASLTRAVRAFFKSFESLALSDLSPLQTQELINTHKLSIPSLLADYTRTINEGRRV